MKNTCKFIHTNVIIFSFFFNLLKMSVSGLIYYLQDLWRDYCLTNTIFYLFIYFFNYFPKVHPGNSPGIYHTADCRKKFICNLGNKLRTNPKWLWELLTLNCLGTARLEHLGISAAGMWTLRACWVWEQRESGAQEDSAAKAQTVSALGNQ